MAKLDLSDMILGQGNPLDFRKRKPHWIRAKLAGDGQYSALRAQVKSLGLHTVCEEARCPNIGECWANGVATIMILGEICTRTCGFCNVKTGWPGEVDTTEPARVAESVRLMGLKYVVITSVDRDDLPDGGAAIWAETIRKIHAACPETQVEVLVPDFRGDTAALEVVVDAEPEIFAHNLETVKRLHGPVRPQARYERSIEVLRRAKNLGMTTKTGIMVGIGERDEEVADLMTDVIEGTGGRSGRGSGGVNGGVNGVGGCDILTIGQYLQPSVKHLPVQRFIEPAVFEKFRAEGLERGFRVVESGPMVRSSYHADQIAAELRVVAG